MYTLDKRTVHTKSDQTLEVIMTDLDPEIMKIFYQEYTSSAMEATKVCEELALFNLKKKRMCSFCRRLELIKYLQMQKFSIIYSTHVVTQ